MKSVVRVRGHEEMEMGGRVPPARMHGQLAQSLASRNLVTSRRRMPACLEGGLRLPESEERA